MLYLADSEKGMLHSWSHPTEQMAEHMADCWAAGSERGNQKPEEMVKNWPNLHVVDHMEGEEWKNFYGKIKFHSEDQKKNAFPLFIFGVKNNV